MYLDALSNKIEQYMHFQAFVNTSTVSQVYIKYWRCLWQKPICMIQNDPFLKSGSHFKELQTLMEECKTSFYIIWVTACSTS